MTEDPECHGRVWHNPDPRQPRAALALGRVVRLRSTQPCHDRMSGARYGPISSLPTIPTGPRPAVETMSMRKKYNLGLFVAGFEETGRESPMGGCAFRKAIRDRTQGGSGSLG